MERLVLWHRALPRSQRGTTDAPAPVDWTREVARRFEAVGGECLAIVGSAVVMAFEPSRYAQALDLALELLTEADTNAKISAVPVISFGVDLGEVIRIDDPGSGLLVPAGAVLDRAQVLANRARPGEVVLGADAQDLASKRYLFSRMVSAAAGAVQGQAIDRSQPRRNSARLAIADLGEPTLPPGIREALEPLAQLADESGNDLVILRGTSSAGAAEYLAQLEQELGPPLVLHFSGVPGALEPLGSLRLALMRRFGSPDAIERAFGEHDEKMAGSLAQMARGEALDDEEVVEAFVALLHHASGGGSRSWLLLDPIAAIDPASLKLVSRIRGNASIDALIVIRLPRKGRLPEVLGEVPHARQWVIPALVPEESRGLVADLLGVPADGDVARRIALLGGATPLGIIEATYTLVAAGDLLAEDGIFDWRISPRGGSKAIPTEALLEERLSMLEDAPHRMLEALCLVPPGSPPTLSMAVAAMDGLDDSTRDESLGQLRRERFVEEGPETHASSALLRALVLRSLPPARASELYRFLAHALGRDLDHAGPFVKATLGYYLAEGGNPEAGARSLLEAGVTAARKGYSRSAVRLAAAAVQFDPSVTTRTAAARISRSVTTLEERDLSAARRAAARPAAPTESSKEESEPEHPDAEAQQRVSAVAVQALLSGDLDKVDRQIETAIAEGRDLAAADRLRAMAHLARGDTASAMRALGRARDAASDDNRQVARASLTLAWIHLHEGDVKQAILAALQALAASRRLRDARGEAATLHTLAACLRALGHEEHASRLADASPL